MSEFKDLRKKFSMHVDLDAFIPATDEEKAYMVQMRPSSTFFRDGVKRLLKNKVATVSLIVIIIITLSSLFIPLFWPYEFGEQLGIQPGKPVDSSYGNLSPFEYGKTEKERMAAGERSSPTSSARMSADATTSSVWSTERASPSPSASLPASSF